MIGMMSISYCQSQQLSSSKQQTLSAIRARGYNCVQQHDNPSIYWYKSYSQYGECLHQLIFEGDKLRKITIGHKDPVGNIERFKDLYIAVTREESLSFDWLANGNGYGKATNTKYFKGKAKYICDTGTYFMEIYPFN